MIREELLFLRGNCLKTQQFTLPADFYNKLYLLFSRSDNKQAFVPIRSMQFLAVIDQEEVIFVHSSNKQQIILSWNHFKPQLRESLADPVQYQCDYYDQGNLDIMLRLHHDFQIALDQRYRKLDMHVRQLATVSCITPKA